MYRGRGASCSRVVDEDGELIGVIVNPLGIFGHHIYLPYNSWRDNSFKRNSRGRRGFFPDELGNLPHFEERGSSYEFRLVPANKR